MNSLKVSAAIVYNVLQRLKRSGATFNLCNNISQSSVNNIFNKHINIFRRTLPERICFDEVYSFKSKELNSEYALVLLDYADKKILIYYFLEEKDAYPIISLIHCN